MNSMQQPVAWGPDDSPRMAHNTSKIVIGFYGWHGVTIPERGRSARRALVDPLTADVLLALSHRAEGDCRSVAACLLEHRLAGLLPVARLVLERQPSISELYAELTALPHWPQILRAFNHTRHSWRPFNFLTFNNRTFLNKRSPRYVTCVANPRWVSGSLTSPYPSRRAQGVHSPIVCDGLKESGNTIFAPIIGPTHYHTLWQLHALDRWWHLLRKHEASRGQLYERVIVSRLDFVWMGEHPSLSLLEPAACAWVPAAENYGGLSDRHAVLSRRHADAYLSRWQAITSGRIMAEHPALRTGSVFAITGERALAAHLRAANVPVCRYAPTAHLACCAANVAVSAAGNQSRPCQNGRCSRLPLRGGATNSALSATHGDESYRSLRAGLTVTHGKYFGELRASFLHGLALRLPGAQWGPVPSPVPVPAPAPAPAPGRVRVRVEVRAAGGGHNADELHPTSLSIGLGILSPTRHARAFNRTAGAALRGKMPASGVMVWWV